MIYEFLEKNRKDIDILTSFLVTVIPIVMCATRRISFLHRLFSENLILNPCCDRISPLETIKAVMVL